MTNDVNIGDVVSRRSELAMIARGVRPDIGDVVEKIGDRCRVAWRDRQVPNHYRPEEMVTRTGKRTWINQKALVKV